MNHGTGLSERTDSEASPRRIPTGEVRSGDTVIHTSRLNATYEFEVVDVGPDMITFETGQMVHVDRFHRKAFTVIRHPTDDASETEGESEAVDTEAMPPARKAPLAE